METQALDFVLASPQEKLDVPVYMKIPLGIDIENGSKEKYLISLSPRLMDSNSQALTDMNA